MSEKYQHILRIMNFNHIHDHSIYVKVMVYDAILDREFHDEVRFLYDMLYGDLVHPERSSLSPDCREYVQNLLRHKYENGSFQ